MPLGWYFNDQWTRHLGPNWVQQKCDKWIAQDRLLKNFANELPMVIIYIVFLVHFFSISNKTHNEAGECKMHLLRRVFCTCILIILIKIN